MSREENGFRFNFENDESGANEEDESDVEIMEVRKIRRCLSEEKLPVWWSKVNLDDISGDNSDEKPKTLGNFVRAGESDCLSPYSQEKDEENDVKELSARKVKFVPSLEFWDPEYCTLFIEFETDMPSYRVIRTLHPLIVDVSCPQWAKERNGCCLTFDTPELATEALNDLEETAEESHHFKVDFLYNVTDRKARSLRSGGAAVKVEPSTERTGSGREEQKETDLEEVPAFEVDYDILRELGIDINKLTRGFPYGKEELESTMVEQVEERSSKVEPGECKIASDERAISLKSISSDLQSEPENAEKKQGKETEDVNKGSLDCKKEVKNSEKKRRRRKKKKSISDLAADLKQNSPGVEPNNLMQKPSLKEETEMKKNEKKKGMKRKLSDQDAGSEIRVVRPCLETVDLLHSSSNLKETTNCKGNNQDKNTKHLKQTLFDQDSKLTNVNKKANCLIQRSSDMKTEMSSVKGLKVSESRFSNQKGGNIDSEERKKKKPGNMSGFVEIDQKMKISESIGENKPNIVNDGDKKMTKKIGRRSWHNWKGRNSN